jgi:glucose-1-phosphate thymidylyltransferase
MKGIILAGGFGTRLLPMSQVTSKQFLPIYDKPMIYYPLSTLLHAGVSEVLIISTPKDSQTFVELLGDGTQFGISIIYMIQNQPRGIAEAIIIGKDFIGTDQFWLILGDNLFHGPDFGRRLGELSQNTGAEIFGYHVKDPRAYGVVEFDPSGSTVLSLEEKPSSPKSSWAVPGLYRFDSSAVDRVRNLKPSKRGELEILDLLLEYLEDKVLQAHRISRGNAWFDLGTPESILHASLFVHTIQETQGLLIGSPHEAAYHAEKVTRMEVLDLAESLPQSSYFQSLLSVLNESAL